MNAIKIAMLVLALGLMATFAYLVMNQDRLTRVGPGPAAPSPGEVAWNHDMDSALSEAAEYGCLIVVDFYADWCGPCQMFAKETLTDPEVLSKLSQFTALKINVDEDAELAASYQVQSIPTHMILDQEGGILERRAGYMASAEYVDFLDGALRKHAG